MRKDGGRPVVVLPRSEIGGRRGRLPRVPRRSPDRGCSPSERNRGSFPSTGRPSTPYPGRARPETPPSSGRPCARGGNRGDPSPPVNEAVPTRRGRTGGPVGRFGTFLGGWRGGRGRSTERSRRRGSPT